MIKSFTVTNPKGESLKLELTRPELSGLIVQSIEGLGPTKATINTGETATMDGSLFNSARASNRNIVITLALMFAPTVEDSRHKTYKYFPVKKRIRLDFETDRRSVYTYGYVESNEPAIFSSQETVQISVICPDPYFYEDDQTVSGFYGAEPLFEFPFSNESYEEDLLELSQIRLDSRAILTYEGDADAGAIISIYAKDTAKNITLYNTGTMESLFIDTDKIETITGKPFGAGDDIQISTIKGDLYVRLLREGVYTNIIAALGKGADFLQLTNGDNIFAVTAEEGDDNLVVTFRYNNAYGGV